MATNAWRREPTLRNAVANEARPRAGWWAAGSRPFATAWAPRTSAVRAEVEQRLRRRDWLRPDMFLSVHLLPTGNPGIDLSPAEACEPSLELAAHEFTVTARRRLALLLGEPDLPSRPARQRRVLGEVVRLARGATAAAQGPDRSGA